MPTGRLASGLMDSSDRSSVSLPLYHKRQHLVSAVMMGLLMFSLGCSVEFRKLWAHIRRPWGIAVGLLCQFGLMPLTAYLLAISFSLKPAQAIAVLVMGCCPGGTISNIFTFWVEGDMDLSITMTTCSTVAALGMMPLCLYLYTLSWNLEQNLTIPYQNIGITLVCLTIPVAFGIYVNYRWPKQSKIILQIGAIVGGVLLLVVAVAGVVLAKGSWNSDITLLTISFIFPLIGHVTGFLLALLTHQSWQRCRTISLETGAQNIQMCVTMLQLSFTAKQLVQMLSFPLAYGLFQLLDGFLIVAGTDPFSLSILFPSWNVDLIAGAETAIFSEAPDTQDWGLASCCTRVRGEIQVYQFHVVSPMRTNQAAPRVSPWHHSWWSGKPPAA
ncbi:sodium-dependent organic anion transporter isoform X2 [Callorhinus ursinus]|uniref:sodium-dependent organic anion transporter isoform X2 n=1 Tax=Callorhinus ursinus TaxID=34884 RepID=UPI003CD039A1